MFPILFGFQQRRCHPRLEIVHLNANGIALVGWSRHGQPREAGSVGGKVRIRVESGIVGRQTDSQGVCLAIAIAITIVEVIRFEIDVAVGRPGFVGCQGRPGRERNVPLDRNRPVLEEIKCWDRVYKYRYE